MYDKNLIVNLVFYLWKNDSDSHFILKMIDASTLGGNKFEPRLQYQLGCRIPSAIVMRKSSRNEGGAI